MVEFNRQERTIKVKIAYYGPAVGGKTTNLKVLYDRARGGRRGEFVSVNSQQDRTILCDLLPLKSGGLPGLRPALPAGRGARPGDLRAGPARGAARVGRGRVRGQLRDRPLARERAGFRELQGHLVAQHLDPATIPMVLQYNKRDLPDVLELSALERALNARRLPAFPAVATRGEGVLETFAAIVEATLEDLSRRYPVLAPPVGAEDLRLDGAVDPLDVRDGPARRRCRERGRGGRHRRHAGRGPLQRGVLGPAPAAALDAGGGRHDGGLGARREARARCSPSPTPRPPPSWGCGSPTCARSATSRARGSPS